MSKRAAIKMSASEDSLRLQLEQLQLEQRPLVDFVRGDPELLYNIHNKFPEFQFTANAVPLEALLPDLATIPAAPSDEGSTAANTADTADAALPPAVRARWSCSESGVWGSAYEPLTVIVERVKTRLLADIEEGTPESISRAEGVALSLVAVGRLYKHVEPRFQCTPLTVPGHEALVRFAFKDLLRAGARTRNRSLADTACKLLIGASFDRLCNYGCAEHFCVRKGRGLDEGWEGPPADADLYGVGCALLSGPEPLAGLRVLVMLTRSERWLVAQVVVGLLGTAVVGAPGEAHTGPAVPSLLLQGLTRCLTDPSVGELQGVFAVDAVVGMLARSENPGALMRCGLGATLVHGSRDATRPLFAALCAFALATMCSEAGRAFYAPWYTMPGSSEEAEVPPHANADPEGWRASTRRRKEEYDAGVKLFRQELEAAGLAMLAPGEGNVRGKELGSASVHDQEIPQAEAQDGGRPGLVLPLTQDAAMELAWAALPGEAATSSRPAKGMDAWWSYCELCATVQQLYQSELDAHEPGLYSDLE